MEQATKQMDRPQSNTGPITRALGNLSSLHQPPTAAGGPCRPSTSAGGTQCPKQAQAEEGVLKGGVERGGFLPYHNFSLLSSSRLHVTTNYTLQPGG